MVPHRIRRAIFNYVPMMQLDTWEELAPGLRGARTKRPWPVWDRPWDVHLTIVDSAESTRLVWTGAQSLFRHATVEAQLHRYVATLAAIS